MPVYDIAVVVKVKADNYEEALEEATEKYENSTAEEVVTYYERDGENQRVLYLHDEKEPDWRE